VKPVVNVVKGINCCECCGCMANNDRVYIKYKKKVNTIEMCKEMPELSVSIEKLLLINQMLILKDELKKAIQIFDTDRYLAIMGRLSVIYCRIRRMIWSRKIYY